MSLQEILTTSGGALVVLMTLVQIAPIKVNPWSAVGRIVGKVINKEVMEQLQTMTKKQAETQKTLDDHIRMDDERNADMHRAYILRFNTELLRNIKHTEEDFNEVLYNIDCYELYCKEHPEYQNNRAVHAIRNINRVYDECMEKHDFL